MDKTCIICNEKGNWKGRNKFCNKCAYKKYKNKNRKYITIICPNCNNERKMRSDAYKKRKSDLCRKCSYINNPQTYKSIYSKELRNTDLFKRWNGMKCRCNSKNKAKWYGNIKVCNDWLNFNNFYNWSLNNGYKKELEIDRIDENLDYCPENCQWITHRENTLKIKNLFGKKKMT